MPYVNDIHDFEKNKEEAKKWAEERYSDWQERLLTRLEKEEIIDFVNNKEDAQQLNKYLEDTRGNLPETSEYRENIERLDKGLKRVKTEQAMFVYQRVSEQYFGYEVGSFREDSIKIDQIKFDEFKEKFIQNQSILKENGYMEASLSGVSPNLAKEPCIYMRLKVPKGTHGGYTGNLQGTEGETHDFLLDRGYGIQFTDAKIITEKGKQYIKVEAELLTKENLDQKIKEYSKELNGDFILPNRDLISLNLTSRYIYTNFKELENIIQPINKIENEFLEEAVEQLSLVYDNPHLLIFTDDKVTNHNSFKHLAGQNSGQIDKDGNPVKADDLNGIHLYDNDHSTIVNFKTSPDPIMDTLHELGHAVDDLALGTISSTNKGNFNEIFQEEQPKFLPDMYFERPKEYFAECFAYYNSPNQNYQKELKNQAPKTYEFLRNLKKYLPVWDFKVELSSNYNVTFNFYDSKCNIYYLKRH